MSESAVAKLIDEQIKRLKAVGVSQKTIAEEACYANPNIMTMFKKGSSKVPIAAVPKLADALRVDKARFMRLVMAEYYPELLPAIEECIAPTVTSNERHLLDIWREATDNSDPEINDDQRQSLSISFAQYANQ